MSIAVVAVCRTDSYKYTIILLMPVPDDDDWSIDRTRQTQHDRSYAKALIHWSLLLNELFSLNESVGTWKATNLCNIILVPVPSQSVSQSVPRKDTTCSRRWMEMGFLSNWTTTLCSLLLSYQLLLRLCFCLTLDWRLDGLLYDLTRRYCCYCLYLFSSPPFRRIVIRPAQSHDFLHVHLPRCGWWWTVI